MSAEQLLFIINAKKPHPKLSEAFFFEITEKKMIFTGQNNSSIDKIH